MIILYRIFTQTKKKVLGSRNALWMLIATVFTDITLIFWQVARVTPENENIDVTKFVILGNSIEERPFKL